MRIFLATQPIDGRKGFDSLAALIRSAFEHDVFSGFLYVFFSKRCDRVRILYWDSSGFALWTKRLERGRFHVLFAKNGELSARVIEVAELALILEGFDLRDAKRRPRWTPEKVFHRT